LICPKPETEKLKCGNCEGDHPANYRGCPAYKEVQKAQLQGKQQYHSRKSVSNPTEKGGREKKPQAGHNDMPNTQNPGRSYAAAVRGAGKEEGAAKGTNRLETLLEKLLMQNAEIISLLTKLINKLA